MQSLFNGTPTVRKILAFTLPTILMMVFLSLYQMVDGLFIANFVHARALSAVNIVFPVISIIIGTAVMLGTGASAIIARKLGEGEEAVARGQFTFIILFGAGLGVVIAGAGLLWMDPMIYALGATTELFPYCREYMLLLLPSTPFAILQMMFQNFYVAAGRPKLGLAVVAAGGVTNIALDYLFMVRIDMGVTGAALGTGIGYLLPAVFSLFYFSLRRGDLLHFTKPSGPRDLLLPACLNGSSEMVSNMAGAVTTFLFNHMMLFYAGEAGVAAITLSLYLQFLLIAVHLGYATGIAPVFSYQYGRQDGQTIQKLFRISLGFVGVNSLLWYAVSLLGKDVLIGLFARKGSEVFAIAEAGWNLFALSFLLMGVNIFSSALFTAFSDGRTSAIISFLRTFLLLTLCILLMPRVWGLPGVWLSVPVAEGLTVLVSAYYLVKLRGRYLYG